MKTKFVLDNDMEEKIHEKIKNLKRKDISKTHEIFNSLCLIISIVSWFLWLSLPSMEISQNLNDNIRIILVFSSFCLIIGLMSVPLLKFTYAEDFNDEVAKRLTPEENVYFSNWGRKIATLEKTRSNR